MSGRTWLRVILLILMATTPLVEQQPQQEARPPMPFAPLREPHFVPPAKADFLKSDDRVVGVSENGISKAYEPGVLAFHHVSKTHSGTRRSLLAGVRFAIGP